MTRRPFYTATDAGGRARRGGCGVEGVGRLQEPSGARTRRSARTEPARGIDCVRGRISHPSDDFLPAFIYGCASAFRISRASQ